MEIIIPMTSVLIVIISFCMGVWTGSLFLCRGAGRTGGVSSGGRSACDRSSGGKHMNTVVAEVCGEDGTYETSTDNKNADGSAGNEMTDEEKRLIKEQQKALEQCMSYSVDMAYGNIKVDR